MSSQLEQVADAIRAIGAGASPEQAALEGAARQARMLGGGLTSAQEPSARAVAIALDVAGKAATEAADELASFAGRAAAFADRLATGGSSSRASSGGAIGSVMTAVEIGIAVIDLMVEALGMPGLPRQQIVTPSGRTDVAQSRPAEPDTVVEALIGFAHDVADADEKAAGSDGLADLAEVSNQQRRDARPGRRRRP